MTMETALNALRYQADWYIGGQVAYNLLKYIDRWHDTAGRAIAVLAVEDEYSKPVHKQHIADRIALRLSQLLE